MILLNLINQLTLLGFRGYPDEMVGTGLVWEIVGVQ